MYEIIAFIFFSVLTLGMFSITVFSSNVLYAMSSLAGGMIFISGFFFLLGAEFLGVVQILVYTGAVMALYAFGMMFFDNTSEIKEKIANKKLIYTMAMIASLLIVFILVAPVLSEQVSASIGIYEKMHNTQFVGWILFTKFLIPFELAAVMLLVAMIAGIVLVGKKMDKSVSLDDNGFIVKESL